MNRFTASFDFPQKEQRRCLSLAMDFNRERKERDHRLCVTGGKISDISLGFRVLYLYHIPLARDHVVDQTVLLGLLGRHEAITIEVLVDPLRRLAGVLGVDLVQAPSEIENLLG